VKYDDETLMAYADGELDEATSAEISAAIEQDPELARRVARHRALRGEIAGAFAGVIDQPVPDHLRIAAGGPRNEEASAQQSRRGNVVQFPARGSRVGAARWRGREWTAMAASLVLGGLIAWQFTARNAGDLGAPGGPLVARGELARALESQLASSPPENSPVRIGLSFKATDGSYCRSFVSQASSAAGLACREGSHWRVAFLESIDAAGPGMRQAATALTPALLQAVQSRIDGEALDAAGERAARDAGWHPSR
jgi:hypothetical protein